MTNMELTSNPILTENCYQISDDEEDDLDDCEDYGDECLLEGFPKIGVRGSYERAWTSEATRALIHVRGPMECNFNEGRQKRTALWLQCTRQLQKMGYRYSAAKVQKKWHNILITYNKNLTKKYSTGYVHWEFFEEMFKYLQGKKAHFEGQQPPMMQQSSSKKAAKQTKKQLQIKNMASSISMKAEELAERNDYSMELKPLEEYDDDSNSLTDVKKPKIEFDEGPSPHMPLEITHDNGGYDDVCQNPHDTDYNQELVAHNLNDIWWKDYFDRKLQLEREKIDLQKSMHAELIQVNKMSMVQQERMERMKIEAINSLTSTLQKLVEAKSRKTTT